MGIAQKKSHGGPMPREDSAFVVLGLTNGPGWTPNPCLASQVQWVRDRAMPVGAYAVVSQPSSAQLARHGSTGPFDAGTASGRLSNAGWAQARFNLAILQQAGLRDPGRSVPGVWIDVEPVPDFDWGTDLAANAAVVVGTVRAYSDAGLRVGVYSTPALWRRIVGDLRLNLPEWRAAGQTSQAEATRRCGADWVIQGGAAVMGQWVEESRDRNVVCPGAERSVGAWFSS